VLTAPGAEMTGRVRAAMALGGASVGWMHFADHVPDRGALREAVLGAACSLADTGAEPDPDGGAALGAGAA
jgi:hypothetical protein